MILKSEAKLIPLLFVAFVGIGMAAYAQKNDPNFSKLTKWSAYPIPTDSVVLESYGWSDSVWTVISKDSVLYAVNTFHPDVGEKIALDRLPPEVSQEVWKNEKYLIKGGQRTIEVNDGYLIGINRGEFGGYLVWYSKSGKKHYRISNDQVIQFIRKDEDIYAIQGLYHLSLSQGSLIKILNQRDRWAAFTLHTLPYAPVGIAINSKDHFVIATSNSLLEINDNEKLITILDNAFWDSICYLYPNSLVIQNDIAYISMRKGVFKVDLNTNKKEWLMKD